MRTALNANEEVDTENDASEADLVLARLEDILSRFEKVLAAEEPESEEPAAEDEEEPAAEDEEAPAEGDEEPAAEDEEEPADKDEEPAAEESYTRQLERRIANLEKRFTESRRRTMRGRFTR